MTSAFRYFGSGISTKKHYDIVVSGGGMIGTALTCLLAQTPLLTDQKILLIEPSKPKQWSLSPIYSNRVSSVNDATKQLMESIGAWDHISKARFKSVIGMKVWDSSGAKVEFDNNQNSPVAYIVENDILINAVEKQLKNATNVTVINDVRVEKYDLPKDNFEPLEILMKDGSNISCNLLVGADGANSQVRNAMGVQYLSWTYGQTAVVATLHLEKGLKNNTAWQRFLTSGPVALLPLTDELSSLVWSTSTEEAKTLLKLSNESFVDALNNVLHGEPIKSDAVSTVSAVTQRILGLLDCQEDSSSPQPPSVTGVQNGSRAAFPLGFGHAASYVGHSVALVGDAAHKVHPLAGQGVNLGYGDISCLVEQVCEGLLLGKQIGHLSQLQEYERMRQTHNVPMMVAIDLMARVYSTQNPAILAAGNIALQVANCVQPIKDMMMRRAAV